MRLSSCRTEPQEKIPTAIPIRFGVNRKLAEAGSAHVGRDDMLDRGDTGPSQAESQHRADREGIQPSHNDGREQAERETCARDQEQIAGTRA